MEQQLDFCAGKSITVTTKLHDVQGAIVSLCMLRGKPLYMVTPHELKRYYGWRFRGGHAQNKAWAVDICAARYADWYSFCAARTDHACDAKLLSEYVREHYKLLL